VSENDINRFILDKLEKVDDKLEEVRLKYSRLEDSLKSHEGLDRRIHASVEKMSDDISQQMGAISTSLDKYNELLNDHMRRTEIAEEHLKLLNTKVSPMWDKYKEREIITNHSNERLKTSLKWLAGISTLLGVILSVMKLLEIF